MTVQRINRHLYSWASMMDEQTREQAERTASMPFIFPHVALMPDCHLGAGSTVGSVIPTLGAIIPAAVGVDIGDEHPDGVFVEDALVFFGRLALIPTGTPRTGGCSSAGAHPGIDGHPLLRGRGPGQPPRFQLGCLTAPGGPTRAGRAEDVHSRTAAAGDGGDRFRDSAAFIDEIPQACKPMDVVMADSSDLLTVRHTLRQPVNVNGA